MIFENQKDFISYIIKLHPVFHILALDVGSKKIGVATSSSIIKIATPIKVIPNDFYMIKKIIEEYEAKGLVLGISGDEKSKSHKMIKEFAIALSEKISIPITFEDERYTTIIANELLKDTGLNRKKRNMIDDMVAAQIILDSFLKKLP